MPVAKKERANHKINAGGKRKMAALIRQANSWHQMRETKQLKPPQNPKRLPTCKHKVEKNTKSKQTNKTTKSQLSNSLQQKSGRLQWTTVDDNCANDKQMEIITFHN